MPKIHFRKNNRTSLEVDVGTVLMDALLAGDVPVASSCRGDGICAKCRIEIIDGKQNLSPVNDMETFLRERHGFDRAERISCQTQVLGDITVDTPYW